ncbi:natriuretic peptides A [Melanotaenia boesemani]|uniref:natriuretic peptides A n=1 Tax=Melanotaenia boesemani TaxID=1250792 RepID=UPI001C046801|nr:natriuretic peptides A [Melanotaenia boesemani]
MRTAVLWSSLAFLCQQCLVCSHVLGRPSSSRDLDQLKSLLELVEENLADVAQEEETQADYEQTNQEPEHSQASRGWSLDQENDGPMISERGQPPIVSRSRAASQRSRLQDLLMSTRKLASGCFGARMDRIGNASGLGCNGGRG